jgi:hypothetical protein
MGLNPNRSIPRDVFAVVRIAYIVKKTILACVPIYLIGDPMPI